ncbi:MAG TPA: hypothetical protein EYP22_07425 [Methanosarcinales archaeon]|nr:hypothetical protein [Methanosarcinales archaeon]
MKLMKLMVVLVIIFISAIKSVASESDVEWSDSSTYTLSWDNSKISKEDYTIRLFDFDGEGSVSLKIQYKNKTDIALLSENQTIEYFNNKIKISAGQITNKHDLSKGNIPFGMWPCCPKAEITVWIAAQKKPEISVRISTDKDSYKLTDYITATVNVSNDGDAGLYRTNLSVDVDGLNLIKGRKKRDLDMIPKDAEVSETFSLKFPIPPNKTSFTITAHANGFDRDGVLYNASTSKTISLTTSLKVQKSITKETLWKNKTYVTVRVENTLDYPIYSIHLKDSIPNNFELQNNTTLIRTFDLAPGESKSFSYWMIAQRPGIYEEGDIPTAVATWTQWNETKSAYSNTPSTTVHGPFIVIEKTIDPSIVYVGEYTNVTIKIENIGDVPARVRVEDEILYDVSYYVSGNLTFSDRIIPHEPTSFSYTIGMITDGEIELPAPKVTFENKAYEGLYNPYDTILPRIKVLTPPSSMQKLTSTSISEKTEISGNQTKKPSLLDILSATPWIEGALPLIMFLVAIIIFIIANIFNKKE